MAKYRQTIKADRAESEKADPRKLISQHPHKLKELP